jgi:two-component system chemotaxis response regulator CheB
VTTPLRILIVDDSATVRNVLRTMLQHDADIRVVGEASNGREAIEQVASLRPDLVVLDVRMPVMDGLETTRQLMAYHPTPILALTASLASYDIDITFQMLGAGALDLIEKPDLSDPTQHARLAAALIRKVRLLAKVKVVTHLRGRRNSGLREELPALPLHALPEPPKLKSSQRSPEPASSFPVVVIGASTGGPRIVHQLLSGLAADFGAAVLIVQHIATGFGRGLAEWLAHTSALPVELAEEGCTLRRGTALVAPDGYDLLVRNDGRIHLSREPLLLQRPAIDVAMQSVTMFSKQRTIGVLLSGMGRDGALGMQAIRRAGGYTIAQDAASCAIYGMPRAAVEIGAVDVSLPPDAILTTLQQRVEAMSS